MVKFSNRSEDELRRVAAAFYVRTSGLDKNALVSAIQNALTDESFVDRVVNGMDKTQLQSLARDLGLSETGTENQLAARLRRSLKPAPTPAPVVVVATTDSDPAASEPSEPPAKPAEKRQPWLLVLAAVVLILILVVGRFYFWPRILGYGAAAAKEPAATLVAPDTLKGFDEAKGYAADAKGYAADAQKAQKAAEKAYSDAKALLEQAAKAASAAKDDPQTVQSQSPTKSSAPETPWSQIGGGDEILRDNTWWTQGVRMFIEGYNAEKFQKEKCTSPVTIIKVSSDPGDFNLKNSLNADESGKNVVTWARSQNPGYSAVVVLPEGWSVNFTTTWNPMASDGTQTGRYNFWPEQLCIRGNANVDQVANDIAKDWMLEQGKDVVVVVDSTQKVTEIKR